MEKIKTNWFIVITLWLTGIAAAMQFAKFSFAFDYLKNLYNVSPFLMGLSLSVVGFIGLVFGITISIYVSKIGQNKILLISLLLGFIISIIQALNPIFPIVFISRIMEGVSHLGIIVTAPIIMIFLTSKKHHSIIMGMWSGIFGIAFSITAWIGQPIMLFFSISGLFLAHSILLLFLFIILLFQLRKIHIPHNDINKIPFLTAHKKVYSNWRAISPGILFFLYAFMYIALLTFLPGLSGDEKTRNLLLIVLPLISIAGSMVAGIILKYYLSPSKLSIFAYTSIILLICVIKMSFNNNLMFIITSTALIFISGIVSGSVFSLIPNISSTTEEQTNASGSVAQLGNLGSTLGPPVFSYFLIYGKNSIIIIVMFLGILGLISGITITKKVRND